MTRKTPVRHIVKNYTRNGHTVHSYNRGNGSKTTKQHKLSTRYLKPKFDTEYIGTVGDIQDDPKYKDYALVTDSQDVEAIWDNFGNDPTVKDFDGFLVKVGDGDYEDVLGFPGTVAYNYKALYRIVKK
jgi:hypothetical protein